MFALASSVCVTLTRPAGVFTHALSQTHTTREHRRYTLMHECKHKVSPVGLLTNSEDMIDYLRNRSLEKHFIPQNVRKRLNEWVLRERERERERVKEKRVLHNLCVAVKMHDLFGPCITPWSLSSSQSILLSCPMYTCLTHVFRQPHLLNLSFISFHFFSPFLFISFHIVIGMACRSMSEGRNRNQRKRRQNRIKGNETEKISGEHWEKGQKNMVNSMKVILHASLIQRLSEWDTLRLLV